MSYAAGRWNRRGHRPLCNRHARGGGGGQSAGGGRERSGSTRSETATQPGPPLWNAPPPLVTVCCGRNHTGSRWGGIAEGRRGVAALEGGAPGGLQGVAKNLAASGRCAALPVRGSGETPARREAARLGGRARLQLPTAARQPPEQGLVQTMALIVAPPLLASCERRGRKGKSRRNASDLRRAAARGACHHPPPAGRDHSPAATDRAPTS